MSDSAFYDWVTELVGSHRTWLIGVARGEGLAGEDALDVVQEGFSTFLTLPVARTVARDASDGRQILTVLVRNHARNARRRYHRAMPHADIDAEPQASHEPTVEQLLSLAEEHVKAVGCVTKLAETQRLVVTLRLLDERSAAETAQQLGTTVGNVGVLLHRAKRALQECISADA